METDAKKSNCPNSIASDKVARHRPHCKEESTKNMCDASQSSQRNAGRGTGGGNSNKRMSSKSYRCPKSNQPNVFVKFGFMSGGRKVVAGGRRPQCNPNTSSRQEPKQYGYSSAGASASAIQDPARHERRSGQPQTEAQRAGGPKKQGPTWQAKWLCTRRTDM